MIFKLEGLHCRSVCVTCRKDPASMQPASNSFFFFLAMGVVVRTQENPEKQSLNRIR